MENHFSDCCGVRMGSIEIREKRCPMCNEMCEIIGEPLELITVEMPKQIYAMLSDLHKVIRVKSVKVIDESMKEDEVYMSIKKQADKLYKQAEEYAFKKRHNIKE